MFYRDFLSFELYRLRDWLAGDRIIQGAIVNGLPVKLDARFVSGSPIEMSHANIVLRNLRLSEQNAPLDRYNALRTYPRRTKLGGAFLYDGYGSTVVFDSVVIGAEALKHLVPTLFI